MPISSKDILYSAGKNDEMYTPAYGVEPILKHIKAYRENKFNDFGNLIVWCAFDTADSEFVKQISKMEGVEVTYSHLDAGEDFFKYEPKEWDILVSNPPFFKKRLFFERALRLDKPFALLMTLTALNDKYPAWSYHEAGKQLQLLKFDKRIAYSNPEGITGNSPTFSSGYYCCDFLKSDLMLEEINKTKNKK